MGSACQVSKFGLRHYWIDSQSEDTSGVPACMVTPNVPTTHHVNVGSVRRKYNVHISVKGYCAGGTIITFDPSNTDGTWTRDAVFSTLSVDFTNVQIRHARNGQDNIQVDVFEVPNPQDPNNRNQIDLNDVIFRIVAQ
jgi:hypothetical protein